VTVTLVPLRAAHAPAMVRWLRDPSVASNLGLRTKPTLAKTRAFITSAARSKDVCARAILVDGAHVGTIVLDHIDRMIQKARLHIYIGESGVRGKGGGRRAVELALELAFGELGLHKVWLTAHARNTAAIRAYEAVGFEVEGTHRGEFLLDGERIDEIYMGALRR
jgi:RimJ/RimL family protein N-acetyltransferase